MKMKSDIQGERNAMSKKNRIKYTIDVGGGEKVLCKGYWKFSIRVPKRKEKKVSFLDILGGISDGSWLANELYRKDEEDCEYEQITFMTSFQGVYTEETRIYFITESDYNILYKALETGKEYKSYYSSAKKSSSYYSSEEKERKYEDAQYSCFNEACAAFFNTYTGTDIVTYFVKQDLCNDCIDMKSTIYKVSLIGNIERQFEEQHDLHCKQVEEEKVKIKTLYHERIVKDFKDINAFEKSKVTNNEKLEIYEKIRELCIKYITELDDRKYDINNLLKQYSGCFSEESFVVFKDNWSRMIRSYAALKRGLRGEEKVAEVLKLFDDRLIILPNYVWGYEHDFVVVTPYGIFTIEVKTLKGNYILTETGILKQIGENNNISIDVALQSKKHIESLRRNLKGCSILNENIPLQEVICSAEPEFTIKNEYHYVPVCYYNTIDKELLPSNGETVLTKEEMQEIARYLLDHQEETFLYDLFLPQGEIDSEESFIKSFAEVASGITGAKNIQDK